MLAEIDIDKSLQLGRIVSVSQRSRITWVMIILIGIGAAASLLILQLAKFPLFTNFEEISGWEAFFQSLVFLTYLFVACLLFYQVVRRMFTMEKLKCIQGASYRSNRAAVEKIVQDEEWRIVYADDRMITVLTNKPYSTTRQLTTIFQDNDVWINVMSFGVGGMSPLFFLKDKEVLNSFLNEFKQSLDAKSSA